VIRGEKKTKPRKLEKKIRKLEKKNQIVKKNRLKFKKNRPVRFGFGFGFISLKPKKPNRTQTEKNWKKTSQTKKTEPNRFLS
jgi:hypothetical protein